MLDGSDCYHAKRAFARAWGDQEEIVEEVVCDICGTVYIKDVGHCEFHLRLVCSWCKKPQGYKPCIEEFDGKISDTICKPCGDKFINEMGKLT